MKRNEALPGKYLAKDDFDPPRTMTIESVVVENVESDNGVEKKPVLFFAGEQRGIILNGTNWDALVDITGKDDSDDWRGVAVEVYHDPTVRFGRKIVGGIRIRAASATPIPEDAPDPKDDIPF